MGIFVGTRARTRLCQKKNLKAVGFTAAALSCIATCNLHGSFFVQYKNRSQSSAAGPQKALAHHVMGTGLETHGPDPDIDADLVWRNVEPGSSFISMI